MGPTLVFGAAMLSVAAVVPQGTPRWRLGVSVGTPRPVSVVGAGGRSQAFWWSVVELHNDTGEARSLTLSARILTDTKKISPAVFRPDVEERIRATLGEDAEGLENVVVSKGGIGEGETKRVLAVFREVDPVATRLDVRIAGAAAAVVQDGSSWTSEQREWSTLFVRKSDEFDLWKTPLRRLREQWVLVSSRRVR